MARTEKGKGKGIEQAEERQIYWEKGNRRP